jgi:hypothetical protein
VKPADIKVSGGGGGKKDGILVYEIVWFRR